MPSAHTCPNRMFLHKAWDYTVIPSMGDFHLSVCNTCSLPRGGFQGTPECSHDHFPVPLRLKTPESQFAQSVCECAKLVESLIPIPTTNLILTDSGEHSVLLQPFQVERPSRSDRTTSLPTRWTFGRFRREQVSRT